jgi:dTDP-4-dehydrorhamnose 3,5-epimerase
MEFEETGLKGLIVIRARVFEDSRGYFFESFNAGAFKAKGLDLSIAQTNISKSDKDVVRGLHYQNPPYAQGKLVRVLQGSVLDVAVDIRRSSPTFGHHFSVVLSGENKLGLWIPPGFAHGFRTLEDDTLFFYDCTATYNKEAEGNIRWNDPALGIDWGIKDPLLSDRDAQAPLMTDCNSLF